MKIIAITPPQVSDKDAYYIQRLLEWGVYSVHLRKPAAGIAACRNLLQQLTKEQRSMIIIHDYPELYEEFSLKGIHVNKNVKALPLGYQGFKTRSCHTLEEVVRYKNEYDYVFLSPIFDSISKVGYKASFSHSDLLTASMSGIIDHKVVALGGVTFDKIAYLKTLRFGGVAMIGALLTIV